MAPYAKENPTHDRSRFRCRMAAVGLAFAIGCGGGGGGDGSVSSPAPEPAPPAPLPIDSTVDDDRSPSTARVVLRNGDRSPQGFVVGNIEDAALSAQGSLALIATDAQSENRAVLGIGASGELETILDSENAPSDVDLATLTRLRMAPSGEVAFQSGSGIDSDQLHRVARGEIETLAGTAGAVSPDFRILGDFRIGSGGRVAFVGGGGDCQAEQNNESIRYLCTISLFLADDSGVARIDHPELELDRRQAKDAEIAIEDDGSYFFSIPGRRASPLILQVEGTEASPIFRRNEAVGELGNLSRIEVVDLDPDGNLLVELGIAPEVEDDPIRDRIGILDGQSFTEFRIEGEISGNREITSLRGLGMGAGTALYEATLRDRETGEESDCLQLGNTESTVEIACLGQSLPGEETIIFGISGARINGAGDVLFITDLGTRTNDTTRLEEKRASVRRSDGTVITIASSRDISLLGTITELGSAGFNDAGQVLLIAERTGSSDRALLLGESR